MNATNVLAMSLTEVADAIRQRVVSSEEVTRACIERAEATQPSTNAFISLEAEEALAAARTLDEELAQGRIRGPLHGVPLAHKDMFYRQGRVVTCGSTIRRNYVPDVTATVLSRLEAAGAVHLGGLNMSEFAGGPTGHNEHFGDCCNPWNPAHITGGSSSGSGASVAARAVFGALGSDTGGSIRIPAACCGVVGMKPTYGLISRHGAMPRSWSLDHMGPLTRTVRDCALMTQAVAGGDPNDATTGTQAVPKYDSALTGEITGMRIGVPTNHFFDDCDEESQGIFDDAIAVLTALGAEIVEVEFPEPVTMARMNDTIAKAEAATIHRKWMAAQPNDYGHHVFVRAEAGFHIPATQYIEALALRGRFIEMTLDSVFGHCDVFLAPVLSGSAPSRAETDVTNAGDVPGLVANLTYRTRQLCYLGLPAMSLPVGFNAAGLPLGVQLVGRPFDEANLFKVGHAYQASTDWHDRTPEL